mmetsp:Transcript_10069/g.61198  ORF Transcript_10069/g.61198 Transcript_10069/m.61198 type:complete len:238 (+) Transcript_10069:4257-4970(+)
MLICVGLLFHQLLHQLVSFYVFIIWQIKRLFPDHFIASSSAHDVSCCCTFRIFLLLQNFSFFLFLFFFFEALEFSLFLLAYFFHRFFPPLFFSLQPGLFFLSFFLELDHEFFSHLHFLLFDFLEPQSFPFPFSIDFLPQLFLHLLVLFLLLVTLDLTFGSFFFESSLQTITQGWPSIPRGIPSSLGGRRTFHPIFGRSLRGRQGFACRHPFHRRWWRRHRLRKRPAKHRSISSPRAC